ncbi:MAG: SRPBCC family protein [Marmoricola sp.]
MPRIVLTTLLPAPAQACFDLSLSVDAHTASMAGSDEQVVGGVTSGSMSLGDSVTWRARHFGIPFTMTSRISGYAAPQRFVDEQVSGPFARWWHEHLFESRDGFTLMTDTVEFASPLGRLGRLVDRLYLTRYMTRLLERRNAWLVEALTARRD